MLELCSALRNPDEEIVLEALEEINRELRRERHNPLKVIRGG